MTGLNNVTFKDHDSLKILFLFSAATALILDIPASTLRAKMLDIAKQVKSLGFFGPFHPSFDIIQLFHKELSLILPPDAHKQASNKVHISLTDGTMNNVIVSKYSTLDELKEALICSCYLPIFSSWKMPTYKEKAYLDGGFSNNQPVLQEDCTLRVSPFSGGSHICPSDGPQESSRPFMSKWGGEKINLTSMNFKRFYGAMMPPENLEELFEQGYDQTETYLRSITFQNLVKELTIPPDSEVNAVTEN